MSTHKQFSQTVLNYYSNYGRHDLPWRQTLDPYAILVSEIMLQQTQVDRVIPKYSAFLQSFPTVTALSKAENKQVLTLWKGLGYNRRAINLKKTAQIIHKEYKDEFPQDFNALIALPGIGPATAGDLMAFAWNIPTPIIETNIRTVYIHHFFPNQEKVSDKQLLPLIEQTLDTDNPREWYWALMDYGTHLKKQGKDRNTQSQHYKKQSKFTGSNRQLRSWILTTIIQHGPVSKSDIISHLDENYDTRAFKNIDTKLKTNLETMLKEGLIQQTGKGYVV